MPQFVDLQIQSLNCTNRIEWLMLLEKLEDLWTWLRFFKKSFKSQWTNFIVFINENVYIGWHKLHLSDGYKYLKQNACWRHKALFTTAFLFENSSERFDARLVWLAQTEKLRSNALDFIQAIKTFQNRASSWLLKTGSTLHWHDPQWQLLEEVQLWVLPLRNSFIRNSRSHFLQRIIIKTIEQ